MAGPEKNGEGLSERQKNRIISFMERIGASFRPSDVDMVDDNLDSMNKGPVSSIWDKVEFLWNRFRTESTPAEKALIIGALLYLIMPLDILPDVLPGLGLIDDVFAILFVFNKITGIGKASLNNAGKRIMERIIDPLIEREVTHYMEVMHYRRIISSMINLVMYVAAILLAVFPVFGTLLSSILASLLLTFAMGYAVYRFIRLMRGKYAIPLIKDVLKEKSVKKGLSSFIRGLDPRIVKIEKFSDKFFRLLGEKGNEKTLERFIDHAYALLKKDIARFILVEVLILAFFFIVRFLLMHEISGLSFFKIVFYPFFLLSDSI